MIIVKLFDDLLIWKREKELSKKYSKLQLDTYHVWVDKDHFNQLKDSIDSIITLTKLFDYKINIRKTHEDGKEKLRIRIQEGKIIIPKVEIIFGVKEDLIYYMNVEYHLGKQFINSRCYMKYNRFIKCLRQAQKVL